MIKNIHKHLIIYILTFFASFLFCKEYTPIGFSAGLSLLGGSPQGDFQNYLDNNIYGINLYGGYNFRNTPITIGANLLFGFYGMTERRVPFSSYIQTVYVNEETTNNIYEGHLFLRLQPPAGRFTPYIVGLIGFNNLTTTTKVTDEDGWVMMMK